MALIGCYREPPEPRQFVPGNDLYEQFSSPGQRVTIADGDGEPIMKLRQRSSRIRVFDADMIPAGQVRMSGDAITQRSRDGQTTHTVDWVDYDTAVIDGLWRLEKSGPHWEITADGDDAPRLLGRLESDGDDWTMLRDDRRFRVEAHSGSLRVVDDDDTTIIDIDTDTFDPRSVLVLAIDELEPVERATLSRVVTKSRDH